MPVPPLTRYSVTGYRRTSDSASRPFAVFELRRENGSFIRYPQRQLIHIAGMVRHMAIKLASQSPPPSADADWANFYVAGHKRNSSVEHRQISYVPLPSIGHGHADHAIRRVMISAPLGDDLSLEHVARLLTGCTLEPENENELDGQGAPSLIRVYRDNVAKQYTEKACHWSSVTPIILPGHTDGKPSKTRRLIESALEQSGIEQPCTFEWSTFPKFRNSLTAHKYDSDKRANFFLPRYLQRWSAIHLTLKFEDEVRVPGPLILGAGRHVGFGLMAQWVP